MIQTSKDVLFLILGVSIFVISFFFSLLLYYLIRVVSELSKTAKAIGRVGQRVDEVSKAIKEKIGGFSLMPLISEAIRLVIEFLRDKRGKKSSSAKASEDEENR